MRKPIIVIIIALGVLLGAAASFVIPKPEKTIKTLLCFDGPEQVFSGPVKWSNVREKSFTLELENGARVEYHGGGLRCISLERSADAK